MFIRRKRTGGARTKVQIVRSERIGAKVRQQVLRHVGTARSGAELEGLEGVARIVMEEMRAAETGAEPLFSAKELGELTDLARRAAENPRPAGVDISECRHEGRVQAGVRQAFGAVCSGFGWDRLFGARRMSANRIVKELALARIAQPLSKRAAVRELDAHGALPLNLDYVCRTMDLIDEAKADEIRGSSLRAAETLLPGPPAAVFYDTTTLCFESEEEDGLRAKGHSRDGKPHRVQVLFAILITPEGLPAGYELFPGDTYEGGTLVSALERLESRLPGTRLTVVADAAMISRENEAALRARGTPYILGARLKNRNRAETERILDLGEYAAWGRGQSRDSAGGLREIETGGGRLIATYSPKRARKDERDRARRIGKLRARLAGNGSAAAQCGRGTARFLDFPDGKVRLNEEKIKAAARWDGLRGIMAWGCDGSDPRDLVIQYRKLSEIEACFRANKRDLRIRPVFHWRPRRIRAHIAICYMAFCCLQHLRRRLAARGHPMSPDRIRRALNELQFSVLSGKGGRGKYGLPHAAAPDAKEIYRTLGLKWTARPFVIERPDPPRAAKTAAKAA